MSSKPKKEIPYEQWQLYVRERIRTFRKKRQLRQGDMASKMGMSRPTYCEIERANSDMRLSTLFRVAEALDVPAYTLLVGVDDIAAQLPNNPHSERTKYREKAFRKRMRDSLVKRFGEAAVEQAEKDAGQ